MYVKFIMIANHFDLGFLPKRKKLLISYKIVQICKYINRGISHMYVTQFHLNGLAKH